MTYGMVAPPVTLDALAADATRGQGNIEFTVVGYGLQGVKPVESAIKQRMVGTVSFVNLTSALGGDQPALLEQSRPGPRWLRRHVLR